MAARDALWRDHHRARWLKPDAHRWIKPDAGRFLKPGVAIASVFPSTETKYSPSQPRVPAGNPRGGQWTRDQGSGGGSGAFALGGGGGFAFGGEGGDIAFDGPGFDLGALAFDSTGDGGGIASIFEALDLSDGVPLSDVEPPSFLDLLFGRDEEQVQLAQSNGGPLDKYGEPYYQRGGHHELPRSIYEKWDLPPETRKVFDNATTGKIPPGTIRTSPDGVPIGHRWDRAHIEYSRATEALSNDYIKRNEIDTTKMSPDQARDLLKEIRRTEDSKIRDYNGALRTLQRLFKLRTGRGE